MLTSQNPDPNARRTFVLFRPFIAVWHWLFPPTLAPLVTLTVHRSSILRARGSTARAEARQQFVNDLKGMRDKLERMK